MSYYKICPVCGSHLDPGEKCDCESPVFQRDQANEHGATTHKGE